MKRVECILYKHEMKPRRRSALQSYVPCGVRGDRLRLFLSELKGERAG